MSLLLAFGGGTPTITTAGIGTSTAFGGSTLSPAIIASGIATSTAFGAASVSLTVLTGGVQTTTLFGGSTVGDVAPPVQPEQPRSGGGSWARPIRGPLPKSRASIPLILKPEPHLIRSVGITSSTSFGGVQSSPVPIKLPSRRSQPAAPLAAPAAIPFEERWSEAREGLAGLEREVTALQEEADLRELVEVLAVVEAVSDRFDSHIRIVSY